MEQDINTLVTKQLVEASDEFDRIESVVKHIQKILDRKQKELKKTSERMIDMETIDNLLT